MSHLERVEPFLSHLKRHSTSVGGLFNIYCSKQVQNHWPPSGLKVKLLSPTYFPPFTTRPSPHLINLLNHSRQLQNGRFIGTIGVVKKLDFTSVTTRPSLRKAIFGSNRGPFPTFGFASTRNFSGRRPRVSLALALQSLDLIYFL